VDVAYELGLPAGDGKARLPISEGHDKGRYINIDYSTDDLPGLWSLIRREVLAASTVGSMLKKAAIIVCQGEKGWEDYLLLHHFDEHEPLDSL
jgi:hypothetical protein